MALLFRILLKLIYFGTTIIFPAYKAFDSIKKGKIERLWLDYFFMMGLHWILQWTLLYPVVFLCDLVSSALYPFLTFLFVVWLIHPDYKGALLIEQMLINYLEFVFVMTQPLLGNILGVPEREIPKRQSPAENKTPSVEKDTNISTQNLSEEKEKSS